MYKKLISFLFYLLICISVFSQNTNDSIQIIKTSTNYRYLQQGNVLSLRQMTQIMKPDKEATMYLKSAKISTGISALLECSGGFLIGYQIGTIIAGKGANLSMLAVGIGLWVVDIPINIATKRNLFKAIHHYNSYKSKNSLSSNTYDFHMGISQNGIGITLEF